MAVSGCSLIFVTGYPAFGNVGNVAIMSICSLCLFSAPCEQPSLVIQLKLVAPQPDSSLSPAFVIPTAWWLFPCYFPSLLLQVCPQAHYMLLALSHLLSFVAPVKQFWATSEGKTKEDIVKTYKKQSPNMPLLEKPPADHCTHSYCLSVTSANAYCEHITCQSWVLAFQ